MSDMFIKIGSIKGESADARHRDEIDVLSWTWGEEQSAPAGGAGGVGGAAAGKVSMQDFVFTHLLDVASPELMKACATGTHMPEAVFSVRKSGGSGPGGGSKDFLVIRLQEVTVSAVSTGGSRDDAGFIETIALRFGKIRLEYRRQNPDGTMATPTVFEWNTRTNKSV